MMIVLKYLCWTHCRASCFSRQKALAVVVEKQCVNQFGFTAGKFADNGNGDMIRIQVVE